MLGQVRGAVLWNGKMRGRTCFPVNLPLEMPLIILYNTTDCNRRGVSWAPPNTENRKCDGL